LRTAIVSALGAEAVRALRQDGVRTVNVKRPDEAHAVTVSLSTRRDRSFVTFNGVNDRLEARLPGRLARERPRHVHLAFAPANCGRWIRIIAGLRARGVTTSWDFGWNPALRQRPGFRELLGAADFIFVNELEAVLYARRRDFRAAVSYWRTASRNTVIKLGPKGSRWIVGDDDRSAPAPRVRVVDTTGAGDAFNGGFLTAWLNGRSPRECLRLGNHVGAQSTREAGGVDALPAWPTRPTRPARARV
jgi:sugar/nucleoside kinase (ribokinase family)